MMNAQATTTRTAQYPLTVRRRLRPVRTTLTEQVYVALANRQNRCERIVAALDYLERRSLRS